MVRQRGRLEGGRLLGSRRLASLWATLMILRRRARSFSVRWETDAGTGTFETKALLVTAREPARRPFHRIDASAAERPELVLFSPQALGVLDLARMASYALAGDIAACPNLDVVRASDIRLRLTTAHVTATLDGELTRLRSPIAVSHHPQRLAVVIAERPATRQRPE